jgi:hypothetical protein
VERRRREGEGGEGTTDGVAHESILLPMDTRTTACPFKRPADGL